MTVRIQFGFDDKEHCCKQVRQFMENVRLLFGLLTPCYDAEGVPRTV